VLCLLVLLTISRVWRPAPQVATKNSEKEFTRADFEHAVNTAVEARINALKNTENQPGNNAMINSPVRDGAIRKTARSQAARGTHPRLTPREREQLAADLRLIPGREEDLPFVFSDEPEQ
jgi:hypothetical protein